MTRLIAARLLHLAAVLALVPLLGFWPGAGGLSAQSQADWDGRRIQQSRDSLQALLTGFEELSQSSAYSESMRSRARFEAALIRSRLEEGDFRVGDEITLAVESEPELSKTYTLDPGPSLAFPGMGQLSLHGVLRSELEETVRQHLSTYIREPRVRASSKFRVTITGEVSQPGFKIVETSQLLTDLLNEAGGPTGNADLRRIRIERDRNRIWDGEALHDAIIEGRTLDALSLRAGDHVIVPGRQDSFMRTWGLRILTPGFVLFLIGQAFR